MSHWFSVTALWYMARVFGWLYCSWLLFSTLQFLRWGGGQVIGSNSTGRGRGGRGRRKNFNISSLLFELSLFYCQNLSAYGFPNSWPPSWLNGLLSKKTPTLFQWENILQNAEVCGHLLWASFKTHPFPPLQIFFELCHLFQSLWIFCMKWNRKTSLFPMWNNKNY